MLSDLHCGSESCDYGAIREVIQEIKGNKIARVGLYGDITECTPPGHHDGGRNSDSTIDAQIIRTGYEFEPIKHKIDDYFRGNHGFGRLSHVGIDPDLILASHLNVPYSTVPTVVRYNMPSGVVKFCSGHGSSTSQDSMKELRRMREIYPDCNVYNLGHDHELFAKQDGALGYDESGNEYWDPAWMCRTGSFLKYSDYARYGFMRPKPTGYLIAHIRNGKVKSIEAVKA